MADPRDMQAPTGFHPDRTLGRDDLHDDPIREFREWLDEAEDAGVTFPNAMALATADAQGHPSVRHVLLRGVDERGLVFYTNRESRKGRDLSANPWASAVFLWRELDRQVTVSGPVEAVDDADSDAYFATRPRDAQIGAWASAQSTVLDSRADLDLRFTEAERRFAGDDVPRPPHWGGYRILAETVEFWQGRAFRLHDRFRYSRDAASSTGWRIERLSP